MSDDDLIRRGDALKAIINAMNVSCAKCGCPRNNHHYRHPFVPSTSTDPKEAIRAIPAADARADTSQPFHGMNLTPDEVKMVKALEGWDTADAQAEALKEAAGRVVDAWVPGKRLALHEVLALITEKQQ